MLLTLRLHYITVLQLPPPPNLELKSPEASDVNQTDDKATSAVSDEDRNTMYERLDAAMIKQMEVTT